MNKWRTVSVPMPLADDIARLIDEIGYWPSLSSFVREACIEKIHTEKMKRRAEKKEGA